MATEREGWRRREIYTAVSCGKRGGYPSEMARAPAVQGSRSRALAAAPREPGPAETLDSGVPRGPGCGGEFARAGPGWGRGRQPNRRGLHPGILVQPRAGYQIDPYYLTLVSSLRGWPRSPPPSGYPASGQVVNVVDGRRWRAFARAIVYASIVPLVVVIILGGFSVLIKG
jgi:hypothetical protein